MKATIRLADFVGGDCCAAALETIVTMSDETKISAMRDAMWIPFENCLIAFGAIVLE